MQKYKINNLEGGEIVGDQDGPEITLGEEDWSENGGEGRVSMQPGETEVQETEEIPVVEANEEINDYKLEFAN